MHASVHASARARMRTQARSAKASSMQHHCIKALEGQWPSAPHALRAHSLVMRGQLHPHGRFAPTADDASSNLFNSPQKQAHGHGMHPSSKHGHTHGAPPLHPPSALTLCLHAALLLHRQERIMTKPFGTGEDRFKYSLFLVLCNRLTSCAVAIFGLLVSGRGPSPCSTQVESRAGGLSGLPARGSLACSPASPAAESSRGPLRSRAAGKGCPAALAARSPLPPSPAALRCAGPCLAS